MAVLSPIRHVLKRYCCEVIGAGLVALAPLLLIVPFALQYHASDTLALTWFFLCVVVWSVGVVASGVIQNQKEKDHCPFVRLALGHGSILLAVILTLGDGRTSNAVVCAAWGDCPVVDWHLWAPCGLAVLSCIFFAMSRLAPITNLCIMHVYLILLIAWFVAGYSLVINTRESMDNSVAKAGHILGEASDKATLVGFSTASGALSGGWVHHAEMFFEFDCHGKQQRVCTQLGLPCDATYVQPLCNGFLLLSAAPLVAAGGGSPVALGFTFQVGLFEDRLARNFAIAEKKREALNVEGVKGQLWALDVEKSSGGQKFWDEAQRRMLSAAEEGVGMYDADGVGRRLAWEALEEWQSSAIKQALKGATGGEEVPQFWVVPKQAQEAWFRQREWALWQGIAAAVVAGVLGLAAAGYYLLLKATLLTGKEQGFLRGHYWGMASQCDGQRQRGQSIDLDEEENELETSSLNDVEHEITFEDVE